MATPPEDATDEVLRANAAFYQAFEERDLDAMSEVWEHSDRVTCVHPGWATLRGWGAVAGSWVALFNGPSELQFILTDVCVAAEGDVAWVTLDENLLGAGTGATVAAQNTFVRRDDGWLLVAHHGAAIASG